MAFIFDVGSEMREVPRDRWPFIPGIESIPHRVWLSNGFMAVLYEQAYDHQLRLTVNRTKRDARKNWKDGITWDELQRIKQECLGDVWCVEVYPPEADVVDVSNMRHLFVLDEPPATRFPTKATVSDDEIEAALGIFKAMIGGR